MESIKLFWIALEWTNFNYKSLSEKWLQCWYIVDPNCSTNEVYNYLDSIDINTSTTFYKTWKDVTDKNRLELLLDQVLHYLSTYWTNYEWDVYVPNDDMEKPLVNFSEFKIIKSATKEEILNKCDWLLSSGIALHQDTITDLFKIYDRFNYLPNIEIVKNKEAKMQICLQKNILPKDNVEFLRFLVFLATKRTLLIKDKWTIEDIISSGYYIWDKIQEFGERKMSEIFLRFKPLFLAFKKAHNKNKSVINRLRKLAKKSHKPYKPTYFENILNDFSNIEKLWFELKKLNNFKKIALIEAIRQRINPSEYSSYIIRNWKFFIKPNIKPNKQNVMLWNSPVLKLIESTIYSSLVENIKQNHKWKTFYIPKYMDIKLPKSEKTFIGNIPFWTEISIPNKDLIIWINWKESDWTRDFDLSFIDIDWNKIWWNGEYNNWNVTFSWDMTSADPEATELFYFQEWCKTWMIKNNRYNGDVNSIFKFFIAQECLAGKTTYNQMVKKENILLQTEIISDNKEQILWIKTPNSFIMQKIITGNKTVSKWDDVTTAYLKYITESQKNLLSLKDVLLDAWLTESEKNPDFDFSDIKKDDIISILSCN